MPPRYAPIADELLGGSHRARRRRVALNHAAAFEKIALGCRILGGEGLTRAAYGHVSQLLDDDLVAIKARGRNEEGLEFVTAADIVTLRRDGTLVDGGEGLVAPNESQIHLEIFNARPDVRSVVHIHRRTRSRWRRPGAGCCRSTAHFVRPGSSSRRGRCATTTAAC